MRPDFLNVQVGDVVAVNQPNEKPYLAQVLFVEGGARTSDPNFLQFCRALLQVSHQPSRNPKMQAENQTNAAIWYSPSLSRSLIQK